jgi:HK97 gp10 family phage protein
MAYNAKASRSNKTYIDGADELIKALMALGEEAGKILDDAAKEGAEIVLSAAKQNIVSNGLVDTGDLLNSMEIKKVNHRQTTKTKASYNVGPRYSKAGKKGINYGHLPELGTSKMQAKPYLRPAADSKKNKVAETMDNIIIKAVEKAWKK